MENIGTIIDTISLRSRIFKRCSAIGNSPAEIDDKQIITLYKLLELSGSDVIDVGGHHGTHTKIISSLVAGKGMVHTFEPSSQNMKELRTRIGRKRNVKLYNYAVSDYVGETNFTSITGIGSSRSALRPWDINTDHSKAAKERINVVTLDSMNFEKKISLIKVDTEGNDLKVLRGARNIIKSYQPVICIEINQRSRIASGVSLLEIWDFISSLNYKIYTLTGIAFETDIEFLKLAPKLSEFMLLPGDFNSDNIKYLRKHLTKQYISSWKVISC